jgi:hypothetical protein
MIGYDEIVVLIAATVLGLIFFLGVCYAMA